MEGTCKSGGGGFTVPVGTGGGDVDGNLDLDGESDSDGEADNDADGRIRSVNLMISADNVLYEYTRDGLLVQSFPIGYPLERIPFMEYARDLVVGPETTVHVYNGTFEPYLSSFDAMTETWTERTHPGWSTVNSLS